ncbi:MAG: hypothetical protein M0Z84_03700 [Gammaproteobacteria bacterium]|nr:hypothetical protein [Gammaproteobacteria bacterium]
MAIEKRYAGADRWHEYHQKTVHRLRQLVEILEIPQVPDGAQIKLREGNDFSHLRRVIRAKAAKAVDQKMSNSAMLSDMSRLLGDNDG